MQNIKINRVMDETLHIDTYGQGNKTTIVLLHGWGMHTGIWRNFAKQLAQQGLRVVCVDLPGHGLSPLQEPFELPSIAAKIINALAESPCYWLGWSLGALVALEIAQQQPKRVLGLMLVAGSPYFVKQGEWAGMEPCLLQSFAANLVANPQLTAIKFMALQVHGLDQASELLPVLKDSIKECPAPSAEVLQAGLAILKYQDLRPVLATLGCPVLVLLGRRDTLVPIALAPHLQQLSQHIQVTVLDKAGHIPFLSHPVETQRILLDFLGALH